VKSEFKPFSWKETSCWITCDCHDPINLVQLKMMTS